MAFSLGDGQQEKMAAYVEEFLLMGQERQKNALEKLARYSESSRSSSVSGLTDPLPWTAPAKAESVGLTSDVSAERKSASSAYYNPFPDLQGSPWGSQGSEEAFTPVKVQVPGIAAAPQGGSSKDPAKLQQATQMLQAALANWEACVSESSPSSLAPEALGTVEDMVQNLKTLDNSIGFQQAQAQRQTPSLPPGLGGVDMQAPAPASSKKQNQQLVFAQYADLLEKALVNMNKTLPAETAQRAQQLLESVAMENLGEVNSSEGLEKLKWLAQLLEHENKASIEKLSKLFKQDPTAVPAAQPFMRGFGWDKPVTATRNAPAAGMGTRNATGFDWNQNQVASIPVVGRQSQSPSWMMGAGPDAWWGDAGIASGMPHVTDSQRKGGAGGAKKRAIPGGTQAQSSAQPEGHQGETLRMHLRSLLNVDSSRVLIVRKINRLGFSSPAILKEHFSWYGTVETVLVAHSRVKSGGGQAGIVSRLRPSGLGFIVMSKTAEAESILSEGSEQHVCGTVIRVQKFERRMSDMGEDGDYQEEADQYSADTRALGA